jgi:hypothetical protein
MWKPTKKQHLANKKYVDENGGGSGSGIVINGVMGGESNKLTFEPIEPNLSVTDLLNAMIVVVDSSGEWVTTAKIFGVNKLENEGFLDLVFGTNTVLTYEVSTGTVIMG